MKFSIIVSEQDSAGMNIANHLQKKFGFEAGKSKEFPNLELVFIEENQIFADNVNDCAGDVLIFASKHASKSEKATLTVHGVGNWGEDNSHGGKKKELVPTSAFLLKNYLIELEKQKMEKQLDYEVILECTHHGPFLEKPAVFIELGSCEKQWSNELAGEAIAETIVKSTSLEGDYKACIGVGGQHYPREFTKLVLRTNYAFSHICPEYNLGNFSEETLAKAIKSSREKIEAIVLDWKGLGRKKEHVMRILENQELPIERARKTLNKY